jgi:hypothetical protein
VQRSKNSLESSEFSKLRRNNVMENAQARLKVRARRGGKTKVEAFENLEILPSGKKVCKLRREHNSRWIGWRRDLDR